MLNNVVLYTYDTDIIILIPLGSTIDNVLQLNILYNYY